MVSLSRILASLGINRIHLVLFGMQNRPFDPCLAASNRILISLVSFGNIGKLHVVQIAKFSLGF
jgi:hypothetical protein